MDASSMRQNSSAPSGIQNTLELNLFKSQQITQQPPKRTKRFQNFQSVGGSLSLSFDTSALEDLLEIGKNEDEIEEEKRRKTINAIGLGRNVADMIATNRSGIEFFAPEYNKDADKQHKKDQQEDKKNLVMKNLEESCNGIKISKERGVDIEKIKKYEEKLLESRDFENEEDEEFWNGISALKTTKYGIATWCIAWNGAAMYLVSDRTGEFLINLLLGILGFWQAKRISKKQNFRKLLSLLTPTLIFIQTALMVLQRSALESFGAFKITLPIATNHQMKKQEFNFQFDGELASVFAIGNTVLMCFVCYCNLSVLRLILNKLGTRLDEQCIGPLK